MSNVNWQIGISVRIINTPTGIGNATAVIQPDATNVGPYPNTSNNPPGRLMFDIINYPSNYIDWGAWCYIKAPGYQDYSFRVPMTGVNASYDIFMSPALPALPSRDQVCGVNLTFQGLTVQTQQFGQLLWFDPYLTSLNDSDFDWVCKQKLAAGDTHAIIGCGEEVGTRQYAGSPNPPITEPLYNPADYVVKVRQNGLIPMIFMDGDSPTGYEDVIVTDEANKQGQIYRLIDKLQNSTYGDLRGHCLIVPGWDSVFYGWEPTTKFGDLGRIFRQLSPSGYLGLEFNTGHIPLGGGPGDYDPNTGLMKDYDVILAELNDQNIHDNNTWGVVERFIGPAYIRPSDDVPPADGGDKHPRPWYCGTPTSRGSYYFCAFEYQEYEWVRARTSASDIADMRTYLRTMGCKYVG